MASSSSHHSIWHPILSEISKALVNAAAGSLSNYAISTILQLLLDKYDDELDLLKSISQDVKDLKEGPYRVGLDWLSNAAKEGIPGDVQLRRIEKAEERFKDALGQEWRDKFRVALIHYHLGICYLMLAQTRGEGTEFWYKEAGDEIEMAYNSAVDYLDEIINRKVGKVKVEDKITAVWGVVTLGTLGAAGPLYTVYNMIRGSGPEQKFFKQIEPVYLFLNDLQKFKAETPMVPLNFGGQVESFLPLIEYIRKETYYWGWGGGAKGTLFDKNE